MLIKLGILSLITTACCFHYDSAHAFETSKRAIMPMSNIPLPVIVVASNESYEKEELLQLKTPYSSRKTYPGIYESDRLYQRNPLTNYWVGYSKLAFVKDVLCSEARSQLIKSGYWKGHLNKDGSCGAVIEPAEWATGNYLNYLASQAGGMD